MPLRFRQHEGRLLICSFYHSFLRLFNKKVRRVVQALARKNAAAVAKERSAVTTVDPRTAEQERAFAYVLKIVIGNKG